MQRRIMRAYDDPLYLIESIPPEDEDDPIREFLVMGTTGNVYTVTIENEPSCTCPDFQLRQRRCKHIFFILMRVMKVDNERQKIYDDFELLDMFSNIPKITHNLIAKKKLRKKYQKLKKKLKETEEENEEEEEEDEDVKKDKEGLAEQKPIQDDDVCPICLDNIKDNGDLVYCKKCGNSLHKKCFEMWCKRNKKTCVFCRGDWIFSSSSERKSRSKSRSHSRSKHRNTWNYVNLYKHHH